jgi:hypothetical protein
MLLLKSGQSSTSTRPLVETKYLLFRNNMTGATSGGGTAYTSEVTRRLLLVEEELPTLQK